MAELEELGAYSLGSSGEILAQGEVSEAAHLERVSVASVARPKRALLSLLAAVIMLGLCSCAVLAAAGAVIVIASAGPIADIMDQYMRAMAEGDTGAAFALLSTDGQRLMGPVELQELVTGANAALFDDYRGIEIEDASITWPAETGPDGHTGAVATVSGRISYGAGMSGSFRAVLERENAVWRIYQIEVQVPPAKVEHYLGSKGQTTP